MEKNENRIEYILNNVMNNKIRIEDLAINDILDISKYLNKYNNNLDKEIYLKNCDLSFLIDQLNDLNWF